MFNEFFMLTIKKKYMKQIDNFSHFRHDYRLLIVKNKKTNIYEKYILRALIFY